MIMVSIAFSQTPVSDIVPGHTDSSFCLASTFFVFRKAMYTLKPISAYARHAGDDFR